MANNAIILFSGGLDSTTCLAIAKSQGFDCHTVTFHYGQKHLIEVERAKQIATHFEVKTHRILNLPLDLIKGSALTDWDIQVPHYQPSHTIPITYVPARNTIFLSMALALGEVLPAHDIFFGANFVDYSNYPDCRPDYLNVFEKLAELATKEGREGRRFKIHAPLLHMNKAEIIKTGTQLGVDYSQTISCYCANEAGYACGQCDSCSHRKKGFIEANLKDPTLYLAE